MVAVFSIGMFTRIANKKVTFFCLPSCKGFLSIFRNLFNKVAVNFFCEMQLRTN